MDIKISLGTAEEVELIGITVNDEDEQTDLMWDEVQTSVDIPEQDPSCISRDILVKNVITLERGTTVEEVIDASNEVVIGLNKDVEISGSTVFLGDRDITEKVLFEKADYIEGSIGEFQYFVLVETDLSTAGSLTKPWHCYRTNKKCVGKELANLLFNDDGSSWDQIRTKGWDVECIASSEYGDRVKKITPYDIQEVFFEDDFKKGGIYYVA